MKKSPWTDPYSIAPVGMFVDDLSVILGFVGATGSVSISFILVSPFSPPAVLTTAPDSVDYKPSVYCKHQMDRSPKLRADMSHPPVISLFKNSESRRDRRLRVAAAALFVWGVAVMIISLSLQLYHLLSVIDEDEVTSSLTVLGTPSLAREPEGSELIPFCTRTPGRETDSSDPASRY